MEKKINYFGIVLAVVLAIAVFLPWISSDSGGFSRSEMGFAFYDMKITPLIALVGAFAAYRNVRWAVILIGVICLIQGLVHFAWYTFAGNVSGGLLSPSFGLFLFLGTSLLFTFSVKKKRKVAIVK